MCITCTWNTKIINHEIFDFGIVIKRIICLVKSCFCILKVFFIKIIYLLIFLFYVNNFFIFK